MRLNLRTPCLLAAFALLGGCSTAPFCDLLDRTVPSKVDSKHVMPYGGVCAPGQGGPAQPGALIVPGPAVPPPPGPVIPPPAPSPFAQPQPAPIPPPPPIPPGMR